MFFVLGFGMRTLPERLTVDSALLGLGALDELHTMVGAGRGERDLPAEQLEALLETLRKSKPEPKGDDKK